MSIITTLTIQAQEVKAPKLKDSIRADLRTLQLQISNGNVQILQIQQQQTQLSAQFRALLDTAVKDSGLDEKKYTVDPNTLELQEKPHATEEGKGKENGRK
jgi:hypothetical protein